MLHYSTAWICICSCLTRLNMHGGTCSSASRTVLPYPSQWLQAIRSLLPVTSDETATNKILLPVQWLNVALGLVKRQPTVLTTLSIAAYVFGYIDILWLHRRGTFVPLQATCLSTRQLIVQCSHITVPLLIAWYCFISIATLWIYDLSITHPFTMRLLPSENTFSISCYYQPVPIMDQ